jgi:hypothetical protein
VTPLELLGVEHDDPLEFLLPMCAFVGAFCSDLDPPIALTDAELAVYAMVVVIVNIDADEDLANGIQVTADQAAATATLFLDYSDLSVFRLLSDEGALDRSENAGLFATVINPLRAAADLDPITGNDTVFAAWDAVLHFYATLFAVAHAGDWLGSLHGADDPSDHRMDITARVDAFGRVQERFIFHDLPPAGRVQGMAKGSFYFDFDDASIDLELRADIDPDVVLADADEIAFIFEGYAEPYVVRGRWELEVDGQGGFDEGDFWLDPSGKGGNALLHLLFTRSGDRVLITGSGNDRTVIGLSDAADNVLTVPVLLEEGEELHFTVLRDGGEQEDLGFCLIWGSHVSLREMTVYVDPRKPAERTAAVPAAEPDPDALRCFTFFPTPL